MPIDSDARTVRAAPAMAGPARRSRAQRTICGGLALERSAAETLQDQIFDFFRQGILAGRFRRGRRLPSSRDFATEQGISRTTVVEAYERLAAEGYVESRARAGIFVAQALPEDFLSGAASSTPRAPARSAKAKPAREPRDFELPLAPGVPAIDQFPWNVWSKLSAEVLRSQSPRMMGWADPRGELPLREAIAEYVGAARGISCTADQVIVTSGSRPVIETVARTVASAGDAVWYEEPGDPVPRAVISEVGLRPVAVPVDEEGVNVEEGLRLAPRARIALVASSHHYPLGVTMSLERRRALLAWATEQQAWIVENEIDGDFRFVRRTQPPLYELDTAGRTVFLGSFNKTLAPGLRIGYAIVPEDLVEAFAAISPMVGVQHQLLLARFWSDGYFASHLRYLREVHARRRDILLRALEQEAADLVHLVSLPEAGLRMPVLFAREWSDRQIARACLTAGIRVGRPLSACYAGASRASGLSLGFASTPEARIRPAVRMLAEIVRGKHAPGARL